MRWKAWRTRGHPDLSVHIYGVNLDEFSSLDELIEGVLCLQIDKLKEEGQVVVVVFGDDQSVITTHASLASTLSKSSYVQNLNSYTPYSSSLFTRYASGNPKDTVLSSQVSREETYNYKNYGGTR